MKHPKLTNSKAKEFIKDPTKCTKMPRRKKTARTVEEVIKNLQYKLIYLLYHKMFKITSYVNNKN